MYQNNIVSQKIPTQTALYQEVVKEIKEDPQNWQWVQTIYNKSMYPLQNSNAKNNIKKLKKTQAYQIGYKIEDLEQQIRRLSKNLDVVKQCNIQLSQNLRQEQKDLKNLENKIQNAKTFSVKGDKGQLSMNLMRNLEREYCSVLSDIKKMQNKITEIRRSPEFFEYRENQTLVNEYQQQILNLDKISKKFEFQSKNKIIKKQEKLKENVKNQKKKIKWLCQHLQQLEQQLIDKEIGNHQIIFEKEHDKLQIENENLKKELKQLEKEVQENEQKLQDQKINKQCLKYTVNIEQSEKEFFQYIDFYQQVFELDDFYLSEIIQDIEENKIDDLFEVLSSSFDIPKNNMKQLKNNKNFENLVCKDQLKSLYDNFRIYKYNKNIQETQQIENEMDLVQLICKYFIFQQQTQINIYDLYQYNLKHKHIQLQKFTKELQNLMDIKKIKDNQLLLEHNIKKVKIDKQDFSIIVKTCSSSISSNSKINKKNIHQEKQIIKEEPKIEKVQKIQKEKVENIIKHKSTKSLQEQTKPEYVPESQKEIQEMIEEVSEFEKQNNYYDYFEDEDEIEY